MTVAYQIHRPSAHVLFGDTVLKPGWYVEFYLTGTSTPVDVWTTSARNVPHDWPVEADSAGVLPVIYLDPEVVYKTEVYDENDVLQPEYGADPANEQLLSQSIIGALLYPQTAGEASAGVTPTDNSYPPGDVRRYTSNSVGTLASTPDWTTAFQAALDAGYSPKAPGGHYGISTTLVTTQEGQVIQSVDGGAVYLHKYADTPIFKVLHANSGFHGITFFGAYDAFGLLSRPANAPSITDTTDNVQIGIVGDGAPAFWVADGNSSYAGRDGVHHNDGPGGIIGQLDCALNSRWGYYVEQSTAYDGGSATDSAHTFAEYLHCHHNGRGPASQTEGGNICIQGHAHVINCKSFSAYGEGIRVYSALSRIQYFSELDCGSNTGITTHAAGQVVTAGAYRRGETGSGVYVATTSGTTGATPLTHTSGTASDGTVTWRFRGNRSVISVTGVRNKNVLTALFENGNREISAADIYRGTGSDGNTTVVVESAVNASELRITHEADFGVAGATAGYTSITTARTANTLGEFDRKHVSGAAGPVDEFFGRSGSTDYPYRVRGSSYGMLTDIVHGGRVKAVTGTSYSLFGVSAAEADVYEVTETGAFEFNLYNGGENVPAGMARRILIVKNGNVGNIDIVSNAQTSSKGSITGTTHRLSTQYDWAEFTKTATSFWLCRGKFGGVMF